MKQFLARLTPPCREVTRLTSESLDRPLPWTLRLSLRIHYWNCNACAEYRRQLVALRQVLHRSRSDDPPDPQLSSSAKARLKETLKAKAD